MVICWYFKKINLPKLINWCIGGISNLKLDHHLDPSRFKYLNDLSFANSNMSTFVIESDAKGHFDSQYPIHLQGLVSPQEYNYLIQGASRFLKQRRSVSIIFTIIQIISVITMIGALFAMFWFLYNVTAFTVAIVGISLFYVFIFIISTIWKRSKQKRYLTELKNFVESNNQQFFISRGVEFLVKTRITFGYKTYMEHVYMEVVVSPNKSGSNGGMQPFIQQQQSDIQQPLLYNQPNVYNQSNMEKSYPQKEQPLYYQQ